MEVARALSTAVADASASARALVVGGGPKFFSNGLDLVWALALDRTALRWA
jgi:enoyl-CoA hydratase/carnithine racemase